MKNTKPFVIVSIISLLFTSLSFAQSSSGTRGGGGAWSCTGSTSGDWRETIDLYEAKANGFKIQKTNLFSVTEQTKQALSNARRFSPVFADELRDAFIIANTAMKHSIPSAGNLELIDDLGDYVIPSPTDCVNGILKRIQVAVYTDNFFNGDLYLGEKKIAFDSLDTNTDRAAIVIHEAIYRKLRMHFKDRNSLRTRQIVGCLFASDLSEAQKTDCKSKMESVTLVRSLLQRPQLEASASSHDNLDQHQVYGLIASPFLIPGKFIGLTPDSLEITSTGPFSARFSDDLKNTDAKRISNGTYSLSFSLKGVSSKNLLLWVNVAEKSSGFTPQKMYFTLERNLEKRLAHTRYYQPLPYSEESMMFQFLWE